MKRAKKKPEKGSKARILLYALFIFIVSFLFVFMIGTKKNKPEVNRGQKINVLITGMDNDGLRTDFMMAASLDTEKKKVNALLIPENTKMYVGGKYQKISAAHALFQNGRAKGIKGTIDAVVRLSAIPFNCYVEFSQNDFSELIDALGGVEFDVAEDLKYIDPVQDLKINIKKGHHIFDGEDALKLLRYESYKSGKSERSVVQKKFLEALVQQKFSPKFIQKAAEFAKNADIDTNLSVKDIINYSNILLGISRDDINFFICPGKSEDDYWIADTAELGKIITDVFGYDAQGITTDKIK